MTSPRRLVQDLRSMGGVEPKLYREPRVLRDTAVGPRDRWDVVL